MKVVFQLLSFECNKGYCSADFTIRTVFSIETLPVWLHIQPTSLLRNPRDTTALSFHSTLPSASCLQGMIVFRAALTNTGRYSRTYRSSALVEAHPSNVKYQCNECGRFSVMKTRKQIGQIKHFCSARLQWHNHAQCQVNGL